MKKLLTFLTMFTLFFGVGWAETVTLTTSVTQVQNDVPTWSNSDFTFTVTSAPSGASYGLETTNNGTNMFGRGFQMKGKGNFVLTSGQTFTNVTKVEIVASTNGAGSIAAKVGNTELGSSQTLLSGTANANTTYTFSTDEVSGNILITSSQTNKDKSVWIQSISVTYSIGGSSTIAKPTITLGPTAAPYYVGDDVTATITAVDGATISYNFDNGDEWTPYTTPVAIPNTTVGDVTIYAKATLDGESSVATKTVTFGHSAYTVEEILTLTGNTTFKFKGNLIVSAHTGSTIYAQDGTGGVHIYNNNNGSDLNYVKEHIIPAGFVARYVEDYHGVPELDQVSGMQNATESGTLPLVQLTPNQITANSTDLFKYAVIEGATITLNNDDKFYINVDDESVVINKRLYSDNVPEDGKTYDVYGVPSWYDGKEFLPIDFVEHQEAPNPDGYYIVGTFTNNWTRMDEWKLQQQSDGSYTLNNKEIPQYAQFKIVKVDGETVRWCGGAGGYWLDNNEVTAINGGTHANLPVYVGQYNDEGSNYYMQVGGTSNVKLTIGNTVLLTVNPVTVYYNSIDPSTQQITETIEMTPTATGWTINKTGMQVDDQFGFKDNWDVWHGGKQTDNNWAQIWEAQLGQPIYMSNDGNFIIKIAGDFNLSVNSDLNQMTADLIPQNYNLTCTAVSDVEGRTGGKIVVKVDGNTVQATEGVYSILSGKEVTLEITPNDGYNFSYVTLNGATLNATVNEGKYVATFTMPRADAAVQANFTGIPYTITVTNDPEEGGTVTGLPATAYSGDPISFTVTPNEGYAVVSVVASFEGNTDVTLTLSEGTYSIPNGMRPYNLEIKVTYKEVTGGGDYVKVTSTADLTDGEYLIVYEGGNTVGPRAFNGALDADHINAANNCVEVEIYDDNTIPSTDAVDAATFTIDVTAGTIKSASGLYIGQTSNNNGMAPDAVTAHENSISIDGSKNAVISCSSGPSLRFNPSWPGFRYYKSGQQPIALYKKVEQPEEVTLAELVGPESECVVGNTYTVTDLICVAGLEDGSLLCKDDNGYAPEDNINNFPQGSHTFPTSDVMTGIINPYNNNHYCSAWTAYDQSNWIILKKGADMNNLSGGLVYRKLKNVTGKLTNKDNPELTLTAIPEPDDNDANTYSYTPNSYVVSSFYGTRELTWNNNYSGEDHTESQILFFVQPKPNELVRVIWAYWDGSRFVNSTEGAAAYTGLSSLQDDNITIIDTDQYSAPAASATGTYKFEGVVKVTTPSGAKSGETYSVMPTSAISEQNTVITGVKDLNVNVNGEVESVTYFNLAGVKSSKPFDGINIVVTRYTDGHTSTSKVIK